MEDYGHSRRNSNIQHLPALDEIGSRLTNLPGIECIQQKSCSFDGNAYCKECTMCGDIGIQEQLFRCKRCLFRYQHLYCSRSYPDLGWERWVCNWCLHAEEISRTEKQAGKEEAGMREVRRPADGYALNFLLQIVKYAAAEGSGDDAAATSHVNPKRQRCSDEAPKTSKVHNSHGITQSGHGKERVQQYNVKPSKGISRRYKLLADVLC